MDSWTETAVTYFTDWEPWNWYATVALILVCVAVSGAIALWLERSVKVGFTQRWYVIGGGTLIGLAGTVALLMLPGTLMRHVKHHENVWWIVIPFVLLALGLVAVALVNDIAAPFVPAGALALGIIFGAIDDALQRAAAWFPTSVVSLIALVAIGTIGMFIWARQDS